MRWLWNGFRSVAIAKDTRNSEAFPQCHRRMTQTRAYFKYARTGASQQFA
jgi:hypothetical protein